MPNPFFTVIMATFGRGLQIVPSIESALRQTFTDFELLVIGDGCTAGSNAVVAEFASPKARWIGLPENSGSQSAPNNCGISSARGTWIAYLGHDDIWSKHHLQRLYDEIAGLGQPDVVVSGCLYHGPAGIGAVAATGLRDQTNLQPSRHFFPPSSIAHSKAATDAIGGWRDPTSVVAPVDADLLLRMADAGLRFSTTNTVTVHKFASGHRYLSYLRQSSVEQALMLLDPRLDRDSAWTIEVAEARLWSPFSSLPYADLSSMKPGDAFVANRHNRGLLRPPLVPLAGGACIPQTGEPRGLDWHGLEQDLYRWSGPNPRPKILIPFTHDGRARVALQVIAACGPLEQIELDDGHGPVSTSVVEAHPARIEATITLQPSDHTILTLHTPTMRQPSRDGSSPDTRRLGVAVAEISLSPVD